MAAQLPRQTITLSLVTVLRKEGDKPRRVCSVASAGIEVDSIEVPINTTDKHLWRAVRAALAGDVLRASTMLEE